MESEHIVCSDALPLAPFCRLTCSFFPGDDKGKPYVLPSVKSAEEKVVGSNLDKEYAGITGVPSFTKAAAILAYGSSSDAIKNDRIAITQSISGTGALRIGGEFLARFYPTKKIYIPTPSWANHNAVFTDAGLDVVKYRYYNKDTIGLDFDGMVADLKAAPDGSIVLLHACAHNPTGIDPTKEQWKQISEVVKSKKHYPFFDMAYQGFASGDTKRDAFPVRHFQSEGQNFCLAQSFAKNMVCFSIRDHANTVLINFRAFMVNVSELSQFAVSRQKRRRGLTRRSRFSCGPCIQILQSTELELQQRS